jgi:uncharacterized protein (TIGR00725 family)
MTGDYENTNKSCEPCSRDLQKKEAGMEKTILVGVIGAGTCDDETRRLAYQVGRYIAEAGWGLVCGGLGGVMEGACQGAADAGGLTIGILPGDSPDTANAYVKVPIATGMGIARNAIIVRSARVAIAVSGRFGTLSEIAFCLKLGVPVISLKSHAVSPEIIQVKTAEEAVEKAAEFINR